MEKVKTYNVYWLGWTLLLTVAAAGVRLWQQATAFEAGGLPIAGAAASVSMVCMLMIAGATLGILAARQPVVIPPCSKVRGRRWDMSFFATGDVVFLTLMWVAAFCCLAAAPNLFARGRALWKAYQMALAMGVWQGGDNGVLGMVTAFLAFLAFFGLLQIGREGYRPGRRGKGGFWAALPACAGCGWLLGTYRNCAADPVLWDYVPLLLAVIAGMLLYTDWAGMSCAAARPRRTLWLAGMTVVCAWVALVSGVDTGTALLLLAQSAAALAALWRLPINLQYPPQVGVERNIIPSTSPESMIPEQSQPETEMTLQNKEEDSHE